MAVEIERKFIVPKPEELPLPERIIRIEQGYLSTSTTSSVRIRLSDDTAHLNIKATMGRGVAERMEYEYEIPRHDGEELMKVCTSCIRKQRWIIPYEGRRWEVDLFEAENKGLVMAEIELPSLDTPITLPPWVGQEVSNDIRYLNTYLSEHPYTHWEREIKE